MNTQLKTAPRGRGCGGGGGGGGGEGGGEGKEEVGKAASPPGLRGISGTAATTGRYSTVLSGVLSSLIWVAWLLPARIQCYCSFLPLPLFLNCFSHSPSFSYHSPSSSSSSSSPSSSSSADASHLATSHTPPPSAVSLSIPLKVHLISFLRHQPYFLSYPLHFPSSFHSLLLLLVPLLLFKYHPLHISYPFYLLSSLSSAPPPLDST